MGETHAPSAEDVAHAKKLTRKLIRTSEENGLDAERARAELESVSHVVSDLVADELVREMDRDALRVCAVYSGHVRPFWFASGRDKMVAKLNELSEKEPVLQSFVMLLQTMQVRKDSLERAGLGRRILSLLGRPWVIAFVWLPGAVLGLAIATVDHTTFRVAASVGLALTFGAVLLQGAFVRRCPSCARTLAGAPVGMRHTGSYSESVQVETQTGPSTVSQTRHAYATLLRCVHCGHRWER